MVENKQQAGGTSKPRPRKRFMGSKSTAPSKPGVPAAGIANQIPEGILSDALLNQAIKQLPSNYSFEIHKTIHHVRKNKAKAVALQMPEGLQMYACTIADIIERFTDALTVIMGDVTYGACCIDDYTAVALGCDMLVHYGHSCLVPIDQTTIKTLYVFVEIGIDSTHLAETVRLNLPSDRESFYKQLYITKESDVQTPTNRDTGRSLHLRIECPDPPNRDSDPQQEIEDHDGHEVPTRLALVSTIQFVAALQKLKEDLTLDYHGPSVSVNDTGSPVIQSDETHAVQRFRLWSGRYNAIIPRSKPLSPGEILGCTAPSLSDVDALVYLGDGRFHLESIMIANPTVPAFRYDPYSKKLTREYYGHDEMHAVRDQAVQNARQSTLAFSSNTEEAEMSLDVPIWGVILGTLGRQGSFKQLQAIKRQLTSSSVPIPHVPILLSELSPAKLALFEPHISTFVQTSCPRLSIDWGYAFDRPLLSPYETCVTLGQRKSWMDESRDGQKSKETYPMDFYAAGSPWAIARMKASFVETV
ncbi:putative diphthamide synthesis protein-domain-containing protein [Pisolithus marmoratus]|nr:putative diphthamide synthesis protein-domain-containing protein [Pisolithus marmoratus]